MIDWWHIGMDVLWLIGLAILLASFSYRRFQAGQPEEASQALVQRPTGLILRLGLICLSLGSGMASSMWLTRGAWLFVALLVVLETTITVVMRSRMMR